jgi:hypothetical protein
MLATIGSLETEAELPLYRGDERRELVLSGCTDPPPVAAEELQAVSAAPMRRRISKMTSSE